MYVDVTHFYSLYFYCIYDTIEIVSFTEKPIFGSVNIIKVSYYYFYQQGLLCPLSCLE